MAEIGSWVWVPDDIEYAIPGQVLAITGGGVKVKLENGEETECKISSSKLVALDKQCLDPSVSNLIGLSNLSENAILHNLRIRFHKECIYTFVSSILIAVNPFRQLSLYGVEIREQYLSTADKSTLPPHIFTVADNSFRAMMTDNLSQSVVISGESGAGKTESTKVLLEYIAELSSDSADTDESLQHQILQCNPVMEAFGNAKTVRNNNSSRFGKLITINFLNGTIKGASIISYLLEKSRVVHQQPLERNYHFFYQLIAAASGDDALSSLLKLTNLGESDQDACSTEDFWYTNQSAVHAIEGMNDLEEYNEVRTALDSLNMTAADQNEVCKVTAAILHMGNITFSEAETAGDVAAKIKDLSSIRTVCSLLMLDENELERCLTSKNIGARSIITCRYTPLQAVDARDALAKKLYASLFDWLIKFINVSLAGLSAESSQKMNFIAVLDIFGFEAFEHNSFEQLCINYCNEKLQFHFNNHIFLMEQEEYAKEGINVSNIKFEDNQTTLDLLELGFTGIFSMIDEEISVPRGSDEQLLSKMFQKHLQHEHFERPKAKNHPKSVIDSLFVVVHYAGPVGYNVSGFLEKNKDQLSEDLEQMCKISKLGFVRTLFGVSDSEEEGEAARPKVRTSRRMGGGGSKTTLGGTFKKQLGSLMDTLNSTEPHFVRCMKPNMEKVGKKFDSHIMLGQLRYAGLVEVCRIRQLGYPYRMMFDKFLSLFTVLAPSGGGSVDKLLAAMVDKKCLAMDDFALGSSKVFLKHATLQTLHGLRDGALEDVVASIQRIIRGKLKRLRFARMKKILHNLKVSMNSLSGCVDVQLLEEALANSVELPLSGVHFPLVKEGRSLFRKVTEETKVKALLEEAMAEGSVAALEGALETAASVQKPHRVKGLAATITEAMSSLVLLKKEKTHLARVPALIKSGNMEDMEQWMRGATELGLQKSEGARSIEVIIARICDERAVMDDLLIATDAKNLPVITALLGKVAEMGLENSTVVKAKKIQQILEAYAIGVSALTTALETSHLQTIRDAISKAKENGVSFDDSLLKRAAYVADMMENVESVEAKLKIALNGQNIDELSHLISKGEQALGLARDHDFSLEISSLSAAMSLVESLNRQKEQNEAEKAAERKVKAEHAEKLQTALDRHEIPYLRSLLVQAKGMGLGADKTFSRLLKTCDEAVEVMKQKQELEIALNSAVRSKNVEKLTQCIANVEASGVSIKLDSALKLKNILSTQASISDKLSDALAKNDVSMLASLLKAAKDANFTSRQVEDARAKLERGTALTQVVSILQNSNESTAIIEAIEGAINLGMDKNNAIIDAARSRLAELSANTERSQDFKIVVKNFEIRASTDNGIRAEDMNPLRKLLSEVIALAGRSGSGGDVSLQASQQDIQMQIARGENLMKQQSLLDDITEKSSLPDIRGALRKAADLGLKNYRGYVAAAALLADLQARAAKNQAEEDQEEEYEEVSYEEMDKLKEEQQAEARQVHYCFSNFPELRTAEEFAKGNLLNKKKIMGVFLKHQKTPISRSLTNLSGTENKQAVIAFKSLLGYLGDKSVTFPASHARDFVLIGLKNQALRAELLLQCIKQTIHNPSPYSHMRAFHVLCMCCDHFPPPPDFHKYLLNFLLDHIDSATDGVDASAAEHMSGYALARIQIMVHQASTTKDALEDVDVEAIEAYTTRPPSVARLFTPDDVFLAELLVAPDVDVETLLLLTAQMLNIHPRRLPLLGLYAVTTKSSDLAPMALIPDHDFYVGDMHQAPLSQKCGRPIKYFIKRKLLEDSFVTPLDYQSEEEEETEEQQRALISLTYNQLSVKMGDDSIRITNEKTAALLAAYQLAIDAEYIAGRADVALAQGVLKNISPTLRDTKDPSHWGSLVAQALYQCVDKEDDELKLLYIELIDSLPTARMHTYMCVKGGGSSPAQTSEVPREFILGVDSKGMFFMDCDDEKEAPTSHYTLRYPLIKKFTLKSNIIKFTLEKAPGELYVLEVVTPLNEELCQLCLAFRPRRKSRK